MFRAVVDGVEPPEKTDPVLQAVSPVDKQIAEENDFDSLKPPGLGSYLGSKRGRNDAVKPLSKIEKGSEHESIPKEVLTEEECKIRPPGRPKEPLARIGREH